MKKIILLLSLTTLISGCSVDPAYQAKREKQQTMISQFVEAAKLGEQVEYKTYFANEITPYFLCNNLGRFGYKMNCYKVYKEVSPKLKTDNETYTLVMDKLYYAINGSEDAMRYRQNKAYEYAQTIPKEQYTQMMNELYDIMSGIDKADEKFQSSTLANSLPLAIEASKLSRQSALVAYGYTDMNELGPQIKKAKALEAKVKHANENAEKRMKHDIAKRCFSLKNWMKKYDHHGFEYIDFYGKTRPSNASLMNSMIGQNISTKILKVNAKYCNNNQLMN
ncbi:hypothetical protein ACB381_23740 [Klebsiella michiganensis]|uniref:hypothetical protein n=1 Tax=Klebsiella/Raoultella group TaxID=2890311 RepID=UPI000FEB827F|nr:MULTISPECIES: hypothetical protein [Klebsiella/Raoultella group]ELF4968710.1 hypothetical protein [Raoultella planticola]ELP0294969.1 hypothetical protein [Klebsiella michiganensis]MCZ0099210.1 hypothetical protein [Raoultella ornithinolytica]RWT38561.1 hypothetical protein DN619_26675 [Klebsiella michiganensis]